MCAYMLCSRRRRRCRMFVFDVSCAMLAVHSHRVTCPPLALAETIPTNSNGFQRYSNEIPTPVWFDVVEAPE
eukprot:9492345-Pyramimonas_sp.AAC.1